MVCPVRNVTNTKQLNIMGTEQRADLIVRNAAKLPYEERVKIAERIMTQCAAKRTIADERYAVLLPIAEEVVGQKMTSCRFAPNVMIRRFVAYRMRKEGYHIQDIARAMGMHHSTIIHYSHQMQDCFDEPIFYAGEIALYMRFSEYVEDEN